LTVGRPKSAPVAWAAIALLVVLAVVRSSLATRSDGFNLDEPFHLVAGAAYVRTSDFRLNPEHPPLVKLWCGAALGPELRLPPIPPLNGKIEERAFTEATVFLENDPDRVQARARMAMFALNGLLMLFAAAAVFRAFGAGPAIGATAFLAIDPTVAAHLPVVMTDLPVALLAVTAILFLVAAFRTGRALDVAAATVALGLTLGAKHSGLVAAVACVAYAVLAIASSGSAMRGLTRGRATAQALVVAVGAVALLWALYGFRFTETRTGEEAFNRPLSAKIDDLGSPGSRRVLAVMSASHVVPRAYTWGLADTVRAGMEGRRIPVNLFGRTYRDRGPFYFFPVVLAAKLPLGLLVLALAGIVILGPGRGSSAHRPYAVAMALLAALFLIALIRGASYAGVRHALPLLVVGAVTGGVAIATGLGARSRGARVATVLALVLAAASALPRIRPWEYYNEAFGGPANAYRHFADEGIDDGQRTRDIASYYHARLEPAGEIPYLFYPVPAAEQKRRGLRGRGFRGEEKDQGDESPTVTGVFIVKSMQMMRNPRMAVFRSAAPVDRMGAALVYRGTFDLPWLREENAFRRAQRALGSTPPDLDTGERLLRAVIGWNPHNLGSLIELGNVMLARGARDAALDFYRRALAELSDEASPLRATLTRQIQRVETEPLETIKRVRGLQEE
jgi:hypothetical protein